MNKTIEQYKKAIQAMERKDKLLTEDIKYNLNELQNLFSERDGLREDKEKEEINLKLLLIEAAG